ncbi:T9SS type A sorting domain-containing protein [bacterium]|nr:T9SS type A sorting domain-containing protein [bacterium]
MKRKIGLLCSIPCLCLNVGLAQGQGTIPATGGTATGTGGSVTYTVGQTAFIVVTGTSGFIIQGVQQPYEISTVTSIEDAGDIALGYVVYPNPTESTIRLVIKSFNDGTYRFQVYNLKGTVLHEKNVSDQETEISMEREESAIYFLRVIRNDREVKVFKIIKK